MGDTVRAYGEIRREPVKRERWAQNSEEHDSKREELRPLPVKSREEFERTKSTVAEPVALPYVPRMHCTSYPLHLISPHVASVFIHSFSEQPDRTQNPDPRTLIVDFE